MFSSRRACPVCGFSIEELTPRMFSFNNPFGACPTCLGIGATLRADPALIIRTRSKPLGKAIAVWGLAPEREALERFGRMFDYDARRPVRSSPRRGGRRSSTGASAPSGWVRTGCPHWWGGGWLKEGLARAVERRWKATKSEGAKEYDMGFMTFIPCPDCHGDRLKPESLAVRVLDRSIAQFSKLPIGDPIGLFRDMHLAERDEKIVGQVVKEIRSRLGFLENVGLTYLTLDRGSATLSGGEAERIALATQIGSGLVGVLYILDEPSIGLHPRDHERLLSTLKTLRDLGNTVLVVEHDEQTMRESDWLIDLGPGGGWWRRAALRGDAEPDREVGEVDHGRLPLPSPSDRGSRERRRPDDGAGS